MWTCPKCGNQVDAGFDVCWACGTNAQGVEDPSFVRADDAGPIADPILDGAAGAPAPDPAEALAGMPVAELVPCYQALSLIEAKFLADQLRGEGIPAVSDTHDMQDALGSWDGNPRVYCQEPDLPRARAWLEAYEAQKRVDPAAHLEGSA